MIALGVGIASMALLISGMLIEYHSERDRIERLREDSNDVVSERLRESLSVTAYDNGTRIRNAWGGATTVTGIIVLCEDSSMQSAPYNVTVRAGRTVSAPLHDQIGQLRGLCP